MLEVSATSFLSQNSNVPLNGGETGRDEVMHRLMHYIEGQFGLTQYKTIYGLAGIGTHSYTPDGVQDERSGERQPILILDWHDDFASDASDASYTKFKDIADLVYNIVRVHL